MAVAALAAFAGLCPAGEKNPAPKPLTRDECRKLVEQLSSKTPPPFAEEYVRELPPGAQSVLDKTQAPIREAYNSLSANFETALPELVRGIGDDRFSHVYEDGSSGVYSKTTVGLVCADLIRKHIEVYHQYTTKLDATSIPRSISFFESVGGIEKWWAKRKGTPLAELQLEAIEWAARQPKPDEFKSDREWQRATKALNAMAADIRRSKRPIPVEHKLYFFSR
jgi:hypothetical protein